MSSIAAEAAAPSIPGPWAIAAAGAVALAVAMGIGRFAFTPLLPMMLHDGVLDLMSASWLATANYIGYLLGALMCTLQPWAWRRLGGLPQPNPAHMVRGGMVATCVLTLAMATPWTAAWPALRFVSGVTTAFVFVYVSGWCLTQLAWRDRGALGGMIYAGPGAGIVTSGLVASVIVAASGSAATGWLVFGVLAMALTAAIWPIFRSNAALPSAVARAAPETPDPRAAGHTGGEVGLLTLAYGFAGFGYIITATFLPVIARQMLPESAWLDLFWPIFGLGVMIGAMLTTRVSLARDLRYLLAGCYLVEAIAITTSLVSPTAAGFVAGSFLLGLPFTAISYFAMQEARRLRPAAVASTMGLLTALYGLGQIVGPPLVALLIRTSGSPARGFTLSLTLAAGALLSGAMLYVVMAQLYPPERRAPS